MKYLILFLIFTTNILATDYYVNATSGNDTQNGLTPETAWKTIAKVNSMSFLPGDNIYFKRGEMWREQLNVPSSGTNSNPIMFGAYGTGARPIINCADTVTTWTEISTNKWYATPPTIAVTRGWGNGYSAILDGTLCTAVADTTDLTAEYQVCFVRASKTDVGTVYLYSTTDPDTRTAEISDQAMGVYINTKSYITIQDLDIRYAGLRGILAYGSNTNTLIDGCYFYGNRGGAVTFIGGYSNSTVQDSKAEYNGNGFYSEIDANNNSFIRDTSSNNIHHPADVGKLFTDGHGFGIYDSDSNLVEYCVADSNSYGINMEAAGNGYSGIFRYNKISNAKVNSSGIAIGNIGSGGVAQVYYNLVTNNSTLSGTSALASEMANVGDVYWYNNTFYQPSGAALGNMAHLGYGNGARFVNNIIMDEGTTTSTYAVYFNNSAPDSMDYNVYYAPNLTSMFRDQTTATSYSDLSAWNTGLGYDGNSVEDNPDFTTNGSDFTLQTGSPAINAGVDVGLTKDILGNPIVGNPDCGAYEYQGSLGLGVYIKPITLLSSNFHDSISTNFLNNKGLIPIKQPFSNNPWLFDGVESINNIPNDMLDWVLLELRDNISTKLLQRAAFLLNNGQIVDVDGSSPVYFEGVLPGDYYLIVHHRNHLSIMSANKISLSSNPIIYNFTDSQSKAYGENSMELLPNGKFGMYSGDGNADGVINNLDYGTVANSIFNLGYLNGDLDMNGIINVLDYSEVYKNILKKTNVPAASN